MTDWNPDAIAQRFREDGLYLSVDRDRSEFSPNGFGNAGAHSIQALVGAWLVGEGERFDASLRRAISWIEDAERRQEAFGEDPRITVLGRKRALAVGLWLTGAEAAPELAGETAALSRILFEPRTNPSPHEFSDHVLDCLAARDPGAAAPLRDGSEESANAWAVLQAFAAGGRAEILGEALGALLGGAMAAWIDAGDYVRVARWLRFAFSDAGFVTEPMAVLRRAFVYLPDVRPPSSFTPPPRADVRADLIVRLTNPAGIDRVDGLARTLGLARDPDATNDPDFASWTGDLERGREVDGHFDGEAGAPWLAVRGEGAGEIALAFAEAFAGEVLGSMDDLLVKVLTPPRGPSMSANGSIRWRALQAALAAAGEGAAEPILLLARAGLKDPDWRVRMSSVLAVGRLRLKALAPDALAAPVPKAGDHGLGQEDRRVLLAMRQAAHDRALGLRPDSASGPVRQAHQARLHSLLAQPPSAPDDRESAMFLALAGGDMRSDSAPKSWRAWLDQKGD